MNTIDQQKAARVWQRVQESKPAPTPDRLDNLQELIMNEWTAAATYQQLSRQLPQKEAAVLQRLAREEHNHGACLRGMYALVTGEKCALLNRQMAKEPAERILRRCYALEMRSLKEYEAKSADPEYGHIFARLAEQEREHCVALLGVIGAIHNR